MSVLHLVIRIATNRLSVVRRGEGVAETVVEYSKNTRVIQSPARGSDRQGEVMQ